MHTTVIENTTFHHNRGFDGDVIICHNKQEMKIPFDRLRDLVAEYVRATEISKLEMMKPEDVLLRVATRR